MVIPGSEEYLEKGISDFLIMEGISVIGPSKLASSLETSKYFTKKFVIYLVLKQQNGLFVMMQNRLKE